MDFKEDLKASWAIGQKDYDTAIEIYKQQVKADGKNLLALAMLAHCYEWKNDIDSAIEYANKVLAMNSTDFWMLLLAARYWFQVGDIDRTYHYVCRALENPPDSLPDIPKWIFWIFKPLSIFSRFRNLENRAKKDLARHDGENKANLKWAREYKRWYEAKHGTERDRSLH